MSDPGAARLSSSFAAGAGLTLNDGAARVRAMRRREVTGPLAVIDIGSNSARLVVLQLSPGGQLEILADARLSLQLLIYEFQFRAERLDALKISTEKWDDPWNDPGHHREEKEQKRRIIEDRWPSKV